MPSDQNGSMLRLSEASASYQLTTDDLAILNYHINQNIKTFIDVRELADLFGWSEQKFETAFRRRTGQSPDTYILCARVEKAKALLSKSNSSIAMVAEESGFASEGHLTVVFTELLGIGPSAYRQQSTPDYRPVDGENRIVLATRRAG